MQRFATLLTLGLLVAGSASAQMLDRTAGDDADVIWARDIGSATLTMDGTLDEPEWASAETFNIKWDSPLQFPGSGQWFDPNGGNPFGLTEPGDPIDATVRILRKGNDLYIGVDALDQSIGGSSGLWAIDGIFMTLIDKNNRAEDFSMLKNYFGSTREELAYSWWNRGRQQDSTATGDPIPGIQPFMYSQTFGSEYSDPDSTDNIDRDGLDFGHTIRGVSNDDFNGNSTLTADTGYTLEFVIPVDSLGWDLTEANSRMPLSIAVQDADYNWPQDVDRFNITRAWWQSQWLNTLVSQGAPAFVAGDPSVTISSGDTPAYSTPEFTVPYAPNVSTPTIDGALDEPVWDLVEPQFTLKYQATPEELDAGLPGVVAPYYHFYFNPSPDETPILDPTEGRIEMFYQNSMLYLGLDTDDQAVNGIDGESGRDGFRLLIRSRDSTLTNGQAGLYRIDLSVDSTGAVRYSTLPTDFEVGTDIMAAAAPKSGTTVADPSDIDVGYQMEVALDLTSLGYSDDFAESGERIWVGVTFFDGDALEDDSQSYGTRVWTMGERGNGASIMGYLDPNALISTAGDTAPDATELRFMGSFPNPTTGVATLRYELATPSDVTVEVFDVLGRRVSMTESGAQPAGINEARIDGRGLSAGTYVVRVRVADGTSVSGTMLITR